MKSHRLLRLTRVCASVVLLCGLVSLIGGTAFAAIGPGFDLLSTPPGGAVLDLSSVGGPANFPLQGRPIGPGNTDTIVQRMGGLPPGGLGPIPAEIVALSLESIAPVQLGPSFFDVFVDLNPLAASLGSLNVTSHVDPGGGTFDSFFDVFARVTLTEVGNPMNQMVATRQDQIRSMSSPWSHIRPQYYPENSQYPSGNFYPGVLPGTGTAVGINHTGPHPHTDPSTPEPASVLLLVMGGVGLGLFGQARRR
ncbi:MAG: PEP-CTERM sorting domain-containing protein [Planctomycetes bacterium]|nr:PEP-CTERM sorting domain-containing protein [Planctomycetota bacterium]